MAGGLRKGESAARQRSARWSTTDEHLSKEKITL